MLRVNIMHCAFVATDAVQVAKSIALRYKK